jgi:tetratricopeptide (TPR) repeat protein
MFLFAFTRSAWHRSRATVVLFTLAALSTATILASCAAAPRDKHMSMAKPGTPIRLLPQALGTYEWRVSTDITEAQAFFNQGMQLRWAYNMPESVASMVRAQELDPTCAMCFWGEAFSQGSFLNGGMSAEQAAAARIAIQRANQLKANSSAMERALIEAASVRYPEDYDPDERRLVDQAFADAMAEVYADYPDNHDVATVYAVSLFLLEDRLGYRDLADPDLRRLHGVLNGVLTQDIKHPGACHLYIHATESSQKPELALACADHLPSSVPMASHIQHMPSHTWNQVGLWGRSVRANIAANNADRRAAQGMGFSYGPTHNLHMLLFAASYDGQGAVATQAGKDYRKYADDAKFEATTLIRFGRFDEVLELDHRPDNSASAAIYDFAKGYAMLKSGDPAGAHTTLTALREYVATTDDKIRFHPAKNVVGVLVHILAGEIQLTDGKVEAAIESFKQAVALEDSLDYDEPEPLPFAARQWLGQTLLGAGQPTKAEAVFRAELEDHPHNGWSLFGLQQALAAQNLSDASVDDDLAKSWARADIWLTGSKY